MLYITCKKSVESSSLVERSDIIGRCYLLLQEKGKWTLYNWILYKWVLYDTVKLHTNE